MDSTPQVNALPKGLLIAMAALVLISLLGTAAVRLSGAVIHSPDASPVATRSLRFEDRADGSGDLPLTLSGEDRIAWLHLWPHARPFHLAHPEPMLRSVPDAAAVAQLLSQAWSHSTGLALNTAITEREESSSRTHSNPSLVTSR